MMVTRAALPHRPPAALRGAGRLVKLVAAGGGAVRGALTLPLTLTLTS